MPTDRHHLPQLTDTDALLLTDGGIETTLIYDDGFDLPDFAAFPLLDDAAGHTALARYQPEALTTVEGARAYHALQARALAISEADLITAITMTHPAEAIGVALAARDAATELDPGDPVELAEHYRRLRDRHPHVRVLGGCCGTNHHHIDAIAHACLAGVPS